MTRVVGCWLMVVVTQYKPSMRQHTVGIATRRGGILPINQLTEPGLHERGKIRRVVRGFTKLGIATVILRAATVVAARILGFPRKNFLTLLMLGLYGIIPMGQIPVEFNRQLLINVKLVVEAIHTQ